MAHAPQHPRHYVCENCQVIHAGTPVHQSGGEHTFEPPAACGACGESTFVSSEDWIHHHE